MPVATPLYYKQRKDIDTVRWNACIERSSNGLIYGYSFYLDHMADNWDALVMNDYEAVMPLPWRKKWGIYYLYQPSLTAQLGLFGNGLTAELLETFFNAIPSRFRLWEFSLNHGNLFQLSHYRLHERMNYVLSLEHSYELLSSRYRETIRSNLKKSARYGCSVRRGIDVAAVIELARQQPNGPPERELEQFGKLYTLLAQRSAAKSYGVYSSAGELLASCVFTFSHHRAYYILVGNHPNGRTLGASHALIDAFIRDHAGQDLLLDFEGSDIRNLAFFYSSFGAAEEKYTAVQLNCLPWYIKWAKE